MEFSLDSILSLLSRKEPLPFEFSRALKNVVNTAHNRGIYTIRLGDLITALKLQMPSEMVGDYSRYFDCEFLYKLLYLLEYSDVTMVPVKVPRNIGENNVVYLLRKPSLQLDPDICKVQELIAQKKSAHTNRERDAIERAQLKLQNYNIAIRIFEYLGAAQLRPLDANQRSVLNDFLSGLMLPHDCDRHVRSMYSYACDCGSFHYNYDNPKYVSKILDNAITEQILSIIAKSIAPSHHSIDVPNDFPFKTKLERFYHRYCPDVLLVSSTVVREKTVRVPLSNRPLSSLTNAQRKSRLRTSLAMFVADLNASAVENTPKTRAVKRLKSIKQNTTANTDNERATHLQQRMGFSEEFLNSIRDLSYTKSERLNALLNKLDDELKNEQDMRLMLPDFSQTRLVVYTPNRSHADDDKYKSEYADSLADEQFMPSRDDANDAYAQSSAAKGATEHSDGGRIPLFDGNPALAPKVAGVETSASFKNSAHKKCVEIDAGLIDEVIAAVRSEEQFDKREQYTVAASAAFKYTIASIQSRGLWRADTSIEELIKSADIGITDASVAQSHTAKTTDKAKTAVISEQDPMLMPSFALTSNIDLDSLTKGNKKSAVQRTKPSSKIRNYRVVPYVFDRLTHLYHSYLVWSEDKDVVLNNPNEAKIYLDEDYCGNVERFLKNPISQEERFNKIAAFELVLRNFFGKGRLACALNNAGDSDASELQRFFILTSRDYALLSKANPLPYLYYHSAIYFNKYLQIPHTHFNNELFYLALLSKEPFAINMYLGRIIRKYGRRIADIPKEFYTLLALWLLLFPPVALQESASKILSSMLGVFNSNDSALFVNVVKLRDLSHQLYLWVQSHKDGEARELLIELVKNPHAPKGEVSFLAEDDYDEFSSRKEELAKQVFNDALRLLPALLRDSVQSEMQIETELYDAVSLLVSDIADNNFSSTERAQSLRFASEYLRGNQASALRIAASFISDAATLVSTLLAKISDAPNLNKILTSLNQDALNDIFDTDAANSSATVNAATSFKAGGASIKKETSEQFATNRLSSLFAGHNTELFGVIDLNFISKLNKLEAVKFPDLVENGRLSGNKFVQKLLPTRQGGSLLVMLLLTGSISNARLSSNLQTLKAALNFIAHIALAVRALIKTKSLVIPKDLTRKASFEYSHVNDGTNKIEITTLKDIDEYIISKLIICSVCLGLMKHIDNIAALSFEDGSTKKPKTAVCTINKSLSSNCYDNNYGKNSPFEDEYIGELYEDYVKPVLRTMLCDDYMSYYSLSSNVDLKDIFDVDRLEHKYPYSADCSIDGMCFNRFVIDSYVYDGDAQRHAELIHFALNANNAYDIGFADGIEYPTLRSLGDLFKRNLGLLMVPLRPSTVRNVVQNCNKDRCKFIKLIAIPAELKKAKASSLYEDLTYSLFCGYLTLEFVHALMDKAKLKDIVQLLVTETVSIHKLDRSNECVGFVYETMAASCAIIRREELLNLSAIFNFEGDMTNALVGINKSARLRHFMTMAFGHAFAHGQANELTQRRFAVLMAKLKFISTLESSASAIEHSFKSFDEVTPTAVKPVKFDMDKIRAKLEESQQVQAVITTLREKEEEEALKSERIKKIIEANRAEAALTTVNSAELKADVAAFAKNSIAIKQACHVASAIAESAADALLNRLATAAAPTAAAPAAAESTASTAPDEAAATPALQAAACATPVAAAEQEHKINQILSAKLREVIEAVAVQGTDAMVFSEFNGICVSRGLLSGNYAIEEINNYTYDEYDAPVLELDGSGNDAIVYIDTEMISQMHSQCKKGS